MIQKGYGCAFGGGTIINAIAAWKGCAYATELKTYAEVTLNSEKPYEIRGEIYENPDVGTELIEYCVQFILEQFDCRKNAEVFTKSAIPVAGGLKSSSAAANASVLAALNALNETLEPEEIVKLGVSAAKKAGVTITGAYDDACASFFGGVAVTDNKETVLLQRDEFDYDVLVLNPNQKAFSAQTNVSRSVLMKDLIETAFDMALSGDYKKAMKLNGLVYCSALGFDSNPAVSCMEIGSKFDIICGLSGTGPSFTALIPTAETLKTDEAAELQIVLEEIKKAWSVQFPDGRIYETQTCNRNAIEESHKFSKYMNENQKSLKELDLSELNLI